MRCKGSGGQPTFYGGLAGKKAAAPTPARVRTLCTWETRFLDASPSLRCFTASPISALSTTDADCTGHRCKVTAATAAAATAQQNPCVGRTWRLDTRGGMEFFTRKQ